MVEVTDSMEAKMLMLHGLNYDYDEIAAELGVSGSTVSKYVNKHEEAAKSASDWESYYWEVVTAAVYDEDFRRMLGGYLSDG